MNRGRGLRTDPDKVAAWQQRTRDKAIAKSREGKPASSGLQANVQRRLQPTEAEVRRTVLTRDGRCLLGDVADLPPCHGMLTFHHRRKASDQGAYVVANGATLCLFHNGWIEDNPTDARALTVVPALVVRQGDPEWEQLGRRYNRDRS